MIFPNWWEVVTVLELSAIWWVTSTLICWLILWACKPSKKVKS